MEATKGASSLHTALTSEDVIKNGDTTITKKGSRLTFNFGVARPKDEVLVSSSLDLTSATSSAASGSSSSMQEDLMQPNSSSATSHGSANPNTGLPRGRSGVSGGNFVRMNGDTRGKDGSISPLLSARDRAADGSAGVAHGMQISPARLAELQNMSKEELLTLYMMEKRENNKLVQANADAAARVRCCM